MTGIESSGDEVARSRKRMIGALAALVVVAALGGGFLAFGGPDAVVQLLAGDSDATTEDVAAVDPAERADQEPDDATTDTDEPEDVVAEEVTTTPEAEEVADTPATSTTSGTSSTSSSGSSSSNTKVPATSPAPSKPPVVTPPTADQQSRMYWEQVGSQEQIGKLVRGEVSVISLGSASRSGSTASIPVTVGYKAGGSLSGTMVLRDYSGTWYFSSISRSGSAGSTPSGSGDTGVVSALVQQQAANQDIPTGIVSGGYKKVTVNGVSQGSGTATLNITLSGGTAAPTSGTITCVSKTIGGVKHWFITSFAK
ncbi:MAG: hypothetical protein RBS17_00230 [Coriobacteriia bacterium]|nr:hypothetical protein [Coriobacteriia bacterium]